MCFHHMFREEAGPGVGLSRVQPLHVQTCPSRLTLAELAPLEPASAVLMRWPIASAACRMGSAERCEYRSVVAAWRCPSSLPRISRELLEAAPILANECLRSCSRTPERSAAQVTRRQTLPSPTKA